MSIIGIVLGIAALGLIYWLRKQQQMDNGLHAAELEHTHQGMNALMNDFNNYQVETDRKITELEKQLESASRMVENFKELYGKVGYPKALSYNLDRKLDKQLWQL